MAAITETPHPGNFLLTEANGHRSREAITVLSGQNLKAGAVIGKVTVGAATGAMDAGNTGDGAITAAPTVGAGAKEGVYALTCIESSADGGVFQVEDPDGIAIGAATVGVEFSTHLTFTITDGSPDFIVGDRATITVASGTDKVKEWNPANTDGSQTVAGVLYAAVDASSADKAGVIIVRDAEVIDDELEWFTGATTGNKTTGKTELETLGIVAR